METEGGYVDLDRRVLLGCHVSSNFGIHAMPERRAVHSLHSQSSVRKRTNG